MLLGSGWSITALLGGGEGEEEGEGGREGGREGGGRGGRQFITSINFYIFSLLPSK